jgi:hypothetical protein
MNISEAIDRRREIGVMTHALSKRAADLPAAAPASRSL